MIKPMQPSPSIPVTDLWKRNQLSEERLSAYRTMIEHAEIRILKVIYEKSSDLVAVQYLSNIPEEWIHQALKECMPEEKIEQMQMI